MAPHPVEYVLFDMDGLLIDSERVYTEVTNTILGRYGLSMSWDTKAGLMGKPEREATEHLFASFPPSSIPPELTVDSFITECQPLKDKLFKGVKPLPGALRLLTHLKKHGVPMAVATSSKRANYVTKTGHLEEMFNLFEGRVICSDDKRVDGTPVLAPGRGKPAPDIYFAAARSLGRGVGQDEDTASEAEKVERTRGLVFEDAIPGVEAGRRSGMGVIWVPDPNLLAAQQRQGLVLPLKGVDEMLSSLEEFAPEKWGLPAYDNDTQ